MIWIALHPVATFANMGIFVLIHEYGMSFLLFLSSLVLEILLIFIKTDFHIIGWVYSEVTYHLDSLVNGTV